MGLIKSLIKTPFKVVGFAAKTSYKTLKGIDKGMHSIDDSFKKVDKVVSKPINVVKEFGLATLLAFLIPMKKKRK